MGAAWAAATNTGDQAPAVAQYYLIPKTAARAVPALGALAQKIEAWFLGSCFWLLGRLSPERASTVAAAVFRWLGPRSGKAKSVRRNFAIASTLYMETKGGMNLNRESPIAQIARESD